MFELSENARRWAEGPRPQWRGWSHRVAAVLAWPTAIVAALSVPAGTPRTSVLVFGVCIAIMFSVSAIAHLRRWSPHVTEVLLRADHTAIYLAIAGTATPIALLGLSGTGRAVVLWGSWGAAVVGIVVEWLPFASPRGFANTAYLTMGWLPVLFLPALFRQAGWQAVALLMAGGALYTVGAVIVGARRPDPVPHVFGYHEIWHLMVVGAVGFHYAMVLTALAPTG